MTLTGWLLMLMRCCLEPLFQVLHQEICVESCPIIRYYFALVLWNIIFFSVSSQRNQWFKRTGPVLENFWWQRPDINIFKWSSKEISFERLDAMSNCWTQRCKSAVDISLFTTFYITNIFVEALRRKGALYTYRNNQNEYDHSVSFAYACILPFPRMNEPDSFVLFLLLKVINNTFFFNSPSVCKERLCSDWC